jgi:hypothetical protein
MAYERLSVHTIVDRRMLPHALVWAIAAYRSVLIPAKDEPYANASSIRSQADIALEDGHLRAIVRHMGAPGSEELAREVATSVSWDVGAVTGMHVEPPARRPQVQRGCYDRPNANAYQIDGPHLGSFISTSSFNHSAPIRGGGQNVAYGAHFPNASAPRPWSTSSSARLTMSAIVGVPTIKVTGDSSPSIPPGVGQLSFGFYLNDTMHSKKKFCFVLQMFDSRPFGDGNGHEAVMSDTYTPFVSVPLIPNTTYATADPETHMLNVKPFGARVFRVAVSSAQLSAAIAAVNTRFPGTDLGTDLQYYVLVPSLYVEATLGS